MIKSFAAIYSEFNRNQRILRKEYKAAGMSEEQIQEMFKFDKEQLARDIAFFRRTQSMPDNIEDFDAESQNPLLNYFLEQLSCEMDLSTTSRYWWVEEIENPALLEKIKKLSDDYLDLITLLIFEGYTQSEIAEKRNCSQSSIAQKLGRIKIFFEI